MRIKCEYCDHYLDDTDAFCGNCGAPNANMMRSANGIPKTIPELQEFCRLHNLPLAQMRFFIGENYQGARAYGIYQDDEGDFVVYKNKSDGSRAIRYEGKDEAYAVNEIYQKLKTEMTAERMNRRQAQGTPPPSKQPPDKKKKRGCLKGCLIAAAILAALLIIGAVATALAPDRYGPSSSSSYGSGWNFDDYGSDYDYDDDDDDGYHDSGSDWLSGSDDSDSGSSWWDDWSSWDDDWDSSDWDWDSGSDWGGGSSDWDSDW
ncbi:MAG: hypothetical protein IKD93_07965 [Firmicutes bacterium]|nr:hypothetical protein [Bacillota bacterium]